MVVVALVFETYSDWAELGVGAVEVKPTLMLEVVRLLYDCYWEAGAGSVAGGGGLEFEIELKWLVWHVGRRHW